MLIFACILESKFELTSGPRCQNSLRSATFSPKAVSLPNGVYPLAPPISGLAY